VVAAVACSRLPEVAAGARHTHHPGEEAEAAAGTHRRGAVAVAEVACSRRPAAVAVAEVACSRRLAAEVEVAEASTLLRAAAEEVVAGPTFPYSFTLQIRSWPPARSFGRPRPASPVRMPR